MQILLFSTLYPNSVQPHHALFVEQRLLHLVKDTDIKARVVAPVPWFPFKSRRFGQYALFAKVPKKEERNGITIFHPRYLVIPKVGMALAPFSIFFCTMLFMRKLARDEKGFDLIDSHFLYPDGIAAILLGLVLSKPVTVTCRGSDVNLHMHYQLPYLSTRLFLRWSKHVITVCQALKDELIRLKLDKAPITVLRNGVNAEVFHPVDRESVRKELGLEGEVWISVGRLAELKGHHLTIEALTINLNASLMLVGGGEERKKLKELAQSLGVADRVRFMGTQPQAVLKKYLSAADVMVLASSREGWANVLLESMACGTPVVASDVGGTAEVIGHCKYGCLVEERSASGIARAVKKLLDSSVERSVVSEEARLFDWQSTSSGQLTIFKKVV